MNYFEILDQKWWKTDFINVLKFSTICRLFSKRSVRKSRFLELSRYPASTHFPEVSRIGNRINQWQKCYINDLRKKLLINSEKSRKNKLINGDFGGTNGRTLYAPAFSIRHRNSAISPRITVTLRIMSCIKRAGLLLNLAQTIKKKGSNFTLNWFKPKSEILVV